MLWEHLELNINMQRMLHLKCIHPFTFLAQGTVCLRLQSTFFLPACFSTFAAALQWLLIIHDLCPKGMEVSFWQLDGQLVRANRQTSAVWVMDGKVLPWLIPQLHLPIRTFSLGREHNRFIVLNKETFFVILPRVHTCWCMLVFILVNDCLETFLFGPPFRSMKNPIRQNALQLIASPLRKNWLWHGDSNQNQREYIHFLTN